MPTKLSGVAYRRSTIASGTTLRTSTNPAARAASDTGGTGDAAPVADGPIEATAARGSNDQAAQCHNAHQVRVGIFPLVRSDRFADPR
jgi:hypothetical protein